MRAPPLTQPARQLLQGRLLAPATGPFQYAAASRLWPQQSRLNSSVPPTSSSETEPTPEATAAEATSDAAATLEDEKYPRYPRTLQAFNLQPLRRKAKYGVPMCDLQLRAYSPRPLEFFSDFALRAAYFLNLPATGPVSLPRITQRWTVPRSHFIFKKSQENYERITMRRLIQIRDGHPESVQIWLAFLQKHAWPGIGMKANMWEFGALDAGKELDEASKATAEALEERWAHLAQGPASEAIDSVEKVEELMKIERVRATGGR